jgi:hypothetical protein
MTETSKTAIGALAYGKHVQIDLAAAARFMATHARVLDRRRFQLLTGDGDAGALLAALDGYGNRSGGYGWGLEPDLRSPESQPGAALHAFEVFEDIAPATDPRAVALCDWLATVTLPDGGLPFALPVTDSAGCAPFWARADPAVSSLQITAVVTAIAHRVATHDAAVAGHPWLARATRYCLRAIDEIDRVPHALVLAFALQFLDAAHDSHAEAATLLGRLGEHIPADGRVHVAGGAEEEFMRPLDFAPTPGRPLRALFAENDIDAELRRLVERQQQDGGWLVDFRGYSPAATLEWRGLMTVHAISVLRRNAVLR